MAVKRTPEEIDAFIRRKHADGSVPGNIGSHLGLPVSEIHERMAALGLKFETGERSPTYHVDSMWNASNEERRYAIWERQRRGARATLKNMARAF